MSTILDALRKVEEDNRARNTDARTRLLSLSARSDVQAPERKRALWLFGTGLVFVGFLVGTGISLWKTGQRPLENEQITAVAPDVGEGVDEAAPVSPLPVSGDILEDPTTPIEAPVSFAPEEPFGQAFVVAEKQALFAEAGSAVHHSPFVSAIPQPPTPPREAAAPESDKPHVEVTAIPSETLEEPSVSPAVSVTVESSRPPPNSSLSFLQWSPKADERIAFLKVNGGPYSLVHEGDTVAGFTVVEIQRDAVEFRSDETSFTLRVP